MALKIPQPPLDFSNESIHRSLTDTINFNRHMLSLGSKHTAFTQSQIDSFTDKSFLGTILFNSDTNESNVSYLDGGDVKWRAV